MNYPCQLKRGFYEKQKTTLLVGYYIKMWQSFLQKIKYQGTNLRNMFESIIHNENLVYHYIYPYCSIKKEVRFENNITEVPTLTYPSKETKNEIIIENTSWSFLKRSELTKYYQIYYIDGLIKDKTSNDGTVGIHSLSEFPQSDDDQQQVETIVTIQKSSIDVHKLINLNLKDHEDTFVPPPPLASGEGESSSAQEIINLDESNFESELKKYKFTLVMFHAPWCKFCKVMKTIFYQLSQEIPSDVARLAMLDGDEFPDVVLDHDVQVFPTLKLYRRGVFVETYDGSGEYSSLLEFIRLNTANKVK